MIDYREIIRLKSLKFSNVAIANSLCCSRNTVSEVLKLAGLHSLEWPVPDTLTNNDIEHLFYPDRGTYRYFIGSDPRISHGLVNFNPNTGVWYFLYFLLIFPTKILPYFLYFQC